MHDPDTVPLPLARPAPHHSPQRRFTWLCLLLGTLLLSATVFTRFVTQYNDMDFGQFYMGGAIARAGAWNDLYPIPHPDSPYNCGENEASTMRPAYAALASQLNVGDTKRFMQPPPNALLYLPLAYLDYHTAHLLWTILSVACAAVIALQTARIHQHLRGNPTYMDGILALLVVTSPTMYQAIRMGQVSVFMGALFGAALLALLGPPRPREAAALTFAALTKYASAILLPMILAMRRWSTLVWIAILAASVVLLSLIVMGVEPWRIWLTQIVPTLSRSHDWTANQSLAGLAIRLTGKFPLQAPWVAAIRAAAILSLLALLAWIFTRPRTRWNQASGILAACTLLLGWMQFFSPIFWTNYYAYCFPLRGYLAWECRGSRFRTVLAVLAIAAAYFPFSVLEVRLPLPVAFHLLISTALAIALALQRLSKPVTALQPQAPANALTKSRKSKKSTAPS